MSEFTILPPLSLYIHIPWCVQKCPYCDFNSHVQPATVPEQVYIDTLLQDLEQHLPEIWGRRLSSVFIGGGTPSLFSAESIDRLLSGVRARLPGPPDIEITLEANPGTVEQGRFNELHAAGINRLSIGIQSFNDDKLQALGRIHNRTEAIKAVETAHYAGFDNFNLDLMFGLPAQTIKQGLDDLHTAIALQPSHLSWYQLTIEPNTFFHSRPPRLPDDEAIWALQQQGQQLLDDRGFGQYEISAYARAGRQCQHNLNYWQFGDYLGIGAGAHGKISRSDTNSVTRHWKLRQPQAYMDARPTDRLAGSRLLTTDELIFEFMLNALRLKQGFEIETFEQHTGLTVDHISTICHQAIDKQLLDATNQGYRPSDLGYRFLNDLINLFESEAS